MKVKARGLSVLILLVTSGIAGALLGEETEEPAFQPYFSYTGEAWSIADGGVKTGGRSLGLATVGFDWSHDLLAGGNLHFEAQSMHGRSPTGFAGDFNALSNIDFDEGTRLFQAWYGNEASWGKWKAGILALDDDFMGSDFPSLFINSGFGPMPIQSGNVAAPIWPIGGLGIHVLMDLSETSLLQLGAYDGDAGSFASNDDGLDNGLRDKEGAMLMLEYAISTEFAGGTTTWKLGGFHHTGEEFENFRTGADEDGLGSLYSVIDHVASEKFGLWARIGFALDEEISTVASTLDGGIVLSALLSNRPDDQLGLGFLLTDFGDEYLAATPDVTADESAIELTYHAPISDNFYLQPDAQWILDAHESQDDVFVLGLRVGIDF